MKSKTLILTAAILLITATLNVIASLPPPSSVLPDYGTVEKAAHVVACLIGLIEKFTPYIMLALIVLAGIKWLASGDDRKERVMAKKYIEMAIVGFVCVVSLAAVATMLGIPPRDCMSGAIYYYSSPNSPALVSPPNGGVLTAAGP